MKFYKKNLESSLICHSIFALYLIVQSLIFLGIGNLVISAFKIDYNLNINHAIVIVITLFAIKVFNAGFDKIENGDSK